MFVGLMVKFTTKLKMRLNGDSDAYRGMLPKKRKTRPSLPAYDLMRSSGQTADKDLSNDEQTPTRIQICFVKQVSRFEIAKLK